MLRVGQEEQPIDLGAMHFDGAVTVSDKYFDLDGNISGARLSTEQLRLELGLARLYVAHLTASATGRPVAEAVK